MNDLEIIFAISQYVDNTIRSLPFLTNWDICERCPYAELGMCYECPLWEEMEEDI